MNKLQQSILDKLHELERAIQGMSASTHKTDLLPLFEEIDRLTSQLPPSSDPELLHFLYKKSYQKARLHLQETNTAKHHDHPGAA